MGLTISPSGFLLANGSIPLTANWNMGAFTATSTQTATTANTVYDAFIATNTTTASSGNQMYGGFYYSTGQGWKTTATAASQSVNFRWGTIPVQGTTNPTGYLSFGSNINAAGWADGQMVLTSAGFVGIGLTAPAQQLDILNTQNAATIAQVSNLSAGTAANAALWVTASGGTFTLQTFGGGFTTSGLLIQNSSRFRTSSGLTGGLVFTTGTTAPIIFAVNDSEVARFVSSNGNLGIGVTGATAKLHIKAGTATASTAPLKFTSGTNLTTAEAGAMEYNGTNLFFTRTGTTREGVLVGVVGGSAPTTSALTAFVNYYGTGGTVALSTPNTWITVVASDGATYKIPAYS